MVQGHTAVLAGDNVYCSFNEQSNSLSCLLITALLVRVYSGLDRQFLKLEAVTCPFFFFFWRTDCNCLKIPENTN